MYLSTFCRLFKWSLLNSINTGTEITFQLNCWQGHWFHSAGLCRVLTLAFLLFIAFKFMKSKFLDMTTHPYIAFNSKNCSITIPCVLCFVWRWLVKVYIRRDDILWLRTVHEGIQEMTSYRAMKTEIPYSASHHHVR